jgi:DNA replication protein DnaC
MTRAPAGQVDVSQRINDLLGSFKLPTLARELVPRLTDAGLGDHLRTILEILELEGGDRHQRRIDRLRRASKLPPGKTFAALDDDKLPRPLAHKIRELTKGEFLDQSINILAFGLPGVGKSHVACALGHALIEAGRSVRFAPAYQLVQELLAAKQALALPRALRQLDMFELLIVDDIGYVKQTAEEAEILFTLMAERYQSRSLMITSNLVFSQ